MWVSLFGFYGINFFCYCYLVLNMRYRFSGVGSWTQGFCLIVGINFDIEISQFFSGFCNLNQQKDVPQMWIRFAT